MENEPLTFQSLGTFLLKSVSKDFDDCWNWTANTILSNSYQEDEVRFSSDSVCYIPQSTIATDDFIWVSSLDWDPDDIRPRSPSLDTNNELSTISSTKLNVGAPRDVETPPSSNLPSVTPPPSLPKPTNTDGISEQNPTAQDDSTQSQSSVILDFPF